jgi:hypothetical protein
MSKARSTDKYRTKARCGMERNGLVPPAHKSLEASRNVAPFCSIAGVLLSEIPEPLVWQGDVP